MNPDKFQLKFNTPEVRDLVWVISSPPLFGSIPQHKNIRILDSGFFKDEYLGLEDRLIKLDNDPSDLLRFLESKNTYLLGKYYESLIEYWLEMSPHKELISVNLQVHKGSNTIGEFDFIYRDLIERAIVHLEAAGKFYIAYNNEGEWSNFIGPNPVDNLRNKMDRLFNHQIKLGSNSIAENELKRLGIEGELNRQIMIKGYIFYHLSHYRDNNFIIPEHSAINHPKGWWLRYGEFCNYEFDPLSRWKILIRDRWISRASHFEGEGITIQKLIEELNSYFGNNRYPLLISELEPEGRGDLIEASRGFVLHPDWPHY